MKKTLSIILVTLGLFIGGMIATGEPPIHEIVTITPHSNPSPSSAETAIDDVITIILDQGFAGAIIVILFLWTYRTDKFNRALQKENFDKFVKISAECSGHMASVSARLENIEREVEQYKQLEMIQASRKG